MASRAFLKNLSVDIDVRLRVSVKSIYSINKVSLLKKLVSGQFVIFIYEIYMWIDENKHLNVLCTFTKVGKTKSF